IDPAPYWYERMVPRLTKEGAVLKRDTKTKKYYCDGDGGYTDANIKKLEAEGFIERVGVDTYALKQEPKSEPEQIAPPVTEEPVLFPDDIDRSVLGALTTDKTVSTEALSDQLGLAVMTVNDACCRLLAKGEAVNDDGEWRLPSPAPEPAEAD